MVHIYKLNPHLNPTPVKKQEKPPVKKRKPPKKKSAKWLAH